MSREAGNHSPSVIWRRYEMKYLISESKAAAIERFIRPYVRPDPYCELQPRGAYPIVTLYLDSKNFQLCRQSLEGKKDRFKLRIRSYSNNSEQPCFFEIKRRLNDVIIKSRVRVTSSEAATLISGTPQGEQGNNTNGEVLKQFMFYTTAIKAAPVLRVRYKRQAFESTVDKKMRITFDRDLCYKVTSTPSVELDGWGWQPIHLNYVVLEVKFTERYPAWLGQIAEYFELQRQSISKYVCSVKHSCSMGSSVFQL